MKLNLKHTEAGLERLRLSGAASGHKGTPAFLAVLQAKADSRRVWRDPVLAAQALAEIAAIRKPRRGRPAKGT